MTKKNIPMSAEFSPPPLARSAKCVNKNVYMRIIKSVSESIFIKSSEINKNKKKKIFLSLGSVVSHYERIKSG